MNIVFNKLRFIFFLLFSIIVCVAITMLHNTFILDNKFQTAYFIFSIIFGILICPVQAMNFNIDEKHNKLYSIILCAFSAFFMCFIVELLNNNNMFTINFLKLLFNYLIITTIYLMMFSITNRIKFSLITSNIFLFILGFANYMVMMFRGTPLSLLDALSIKTGISVAFTYKLNPTFYLIIATVGFMLLSSIILCFNCKNIKKLRLFRIIGLLSTIIVFLVIYTTNFISLFRLDTDLWTPSNEYKSNGFLASFVKQINEINMEKPEEYSLELISEIKDASYVEEVKYANAQTESKRSRK